MVMGHKLAVSRSVLAFTVPLCSFLLAGCNGENGSAARGQTTGKSTPISEQKSDKAVLKELADGNAPRSVTFENPGYGDPAGYLDAKQPMVAFTLYNAKRNWSESAEDIADSMGDPFTIRNANPELYRLASERQSTNDSFKKKELTTALGSLVNRDVETAKQRSLVKLSSDDWTPILLGSYDQAAQGFRIDSCLFSDKLEYTAEEKRNATSLAQAPKLRCYLTPGPTNYFIGFQGGSQLLLSVTDEILARKIEASRDSLKMDIYGYVKTIERERYAGEFGPQRFVLIAPQRIDLKDASGKVLFTKDI